MTCHPRSSAESVDLRIALVRDARAHDGARPCRVLDEAPHGTVWRDALDLGARWRWEGAGDLGLALVHVAGEREPRRMAIERIEGHAAPAARRGPQQGSSRHAAALALRRRCPVCHAPEGARCRKRRDASGRVTEVLHAERLTEVQA